MNSSVPESRTLRQVYNREMNYLVCGRADEDSVLFSDNAHTVCTLCGCELICDPKSLPLIEAKQVEPICQVCCVARMMASDAEPEFRGMVGGVEYTDLNEAAKAAWSQVKRRQG